MRVQLGRASHILEQDMWTVIVHSISVVSKRESKNIERVVGRLSFRRSSPSLRVMHNDMDHNKSTRKALKAHRPWFPLIRLLKNDGVARSKLKAHVVLFFLLVRSASRCIRRGGRFLCYRGLFCFGAGPRPGHRQIKSDVAFVLIFQRRLFPRKWKRVWKCLFPVWKQRLRDTQIFRRITNNRFMQVSCKVFTALRHESRGTEEN